MRLSNSTLLPIFAVPLSCFVYWLYGHDGTTGFLCGVIFTVAMTDWANRRNRAAQERLAEEKRQASVRGAP